MIASLILACSMAFPAAAEYSETDETIVKLVACSYAEFGSGTEATEFGVTIILNRYERLGAWDSLDDYLSSRDFAGRTRKMVQAAEEGTFRAAGEEWKIFGKEIDLARRILELPKEERITDADEWDCRSDIDYIDDNGRVHNRYGSRYTYYGKAYGNIYGRM